MVDFQERETRRSLEDDGDLDPRNPDEAADSDEGSGTSGESGDGSRQAAGGDGRADSGADGTPADAEQSTTGTEASTAESDTPTAGAEPSAEGDQLAADGDGRDDGEDGLGPDGRVRAAGGDDQADGEAEIDRVREQLEERPVTDGASESLDPPTEADELVESDTDDEAEDDEDHDADNDADHDHHHHDVETLGAAVVTVSTSRTLADDPSGDHIVESLVDAGHEVVTRELIPDDYDDIQSVVATLVNRDDVDVVVSTGGTGVTPDDRTIEAVRPLFDKELPGFGEYFRRLSEDEIGSRIVGTRATAGVAEGVPVFCLPGSRNAVALGVEEIIVEEAPHLAGLAQRDDEHDGHDESDADEADVEEAADDPFGG